MGNQQQTHHTVPIIALNRLEIKITGKLGKQDLERLYTEVRFGVADLSPGFDVINDLRECTLGSLDAIEALNKITNFLIGNKVKVIVRIVNNKQIVSKQATNLETKRQGYQVIYVHSKEKAEQELKKSNQREGLRVYLLNHSIEYTTGVQTGTGTLLDISTSGCAVKSATVVPELDVNISLRVVFKSHLDLLENLKCTGQIVWVDKSDFAVKFDTLENALMESLWNRLVYECKKDFNL